MSPANGYRLLDDALLEEIAAAPQEVQAEWLILSPSREFQGRWSVDCLHPEFFFDFEAEIGRYRTVTPARLGEFLALVEERGYHVAFEEPPERILEGLERLKEPPPFSIESRLPETVQGFLPWQISGFNKLIRDESISTGLFIGDTGTGKSLLLAMAILWHRDHGHPFDLALVVVKSINRLDMQAKLLRLAGIESIVVDGVSTLKSTGAEKRAEIYRDVEERLRSGEKVVLIVNYEKLRDEEDYFKSLVRRRDVLFFFDEMPTRLSNRGTQLWKATKRIMWESHWSKARPRWSRSWELTATPLENSPDDIFACLALMEPGLLGRAGEFYREYVAYMNPLSRKPEKWRNLDKLEARLEHMTHRVSRKDPEVAKHFPRGMHDTLVVPWAPRDRAIYDRLVAMTKARVEGEEEPNVLAMIQVMQMMCDAPSMLVESAQNREAFLALLSDCEDGKGDLPVEGTKGSEIALRLIEGLPSPPDDRTHAKFEMLKEILTVKHPDEKVLIYMTWSSYGFGPLSRKLEEWGISYVTFAGTAKQRQEAKERFRTDPSIRVFLSSDAGSDSIDLPEATIGVNYNQPWKYTTVLQREGRNDRVDSPAEIIYWYDLIMAASVEQRKLEIIERKRGYHEEIFDGIAIDETMTSRMTSEDLMYMLWGEG